MESFRGSILLCYEVLWYTCSNMSDRYVTCSTCLSYKRGVTELANDAAGPSYREIAAFFLPLSITNLMLVTSHSIVNAGVARTPQPELALASYALARSLVRLIENPVFMVRQTVVSLVKDRDSYNQVRRFIYGITAFVTFVIAILAFTPAGYYAFHSVMGATHDIAVHSHMALKILVFMPFAAVTRNMYHGTAILSRQTMLVPKSSFLRLIIMTSIIFPLALWTNWPGAVSASIAFIGAFWVEALMMRSRAMPLLHRDDVFPKKPKIQLPYRTIAKFFLPLVLTTLTATAFAPLIQAGLARSYDPVLALAAYSVGNALGQLFCAPLNMLHQCTLAFTKVGQLVTYRKTKTFTIGFALAASSALALVSFSPLGTFLVERLIGLSGSTAESALLVMRVKTLLPLALGWREYLWGIFMQQHMTQLIGRGKIINLVALLAVLAFLLGGRYGDPAAAGAWAMVIGEIAECIYMQIRFRQSSVYKKLQPVLENS